WPLRELRIPCLLFGARQIERREGADRGLAHRDHLGAAIDHGGGCEIAGLEPAREIERREHHAFPSIRPTTRRVTLRANGIATKAVTLATGQPTRKAESQRGTKSTRRPMLKKVTTALTMKTMIAVITTGKMNFALPSMPALPFAPPRCDRKRPAGSRGHQVFTMRTAGAARGRIVLMPR